MKVVLIRPDPGKAIYASIPPLGMGYIATNLRKIGIEPELWDLALGRKKTAEFMKRVESGPEIDVVGIQVYSRDIQQTKMLVDRISKRLPERAVVILGGPHATVATGHALEYLDRADFAFVGEADRGFPVVVERLSRGQGLKDAQIKGLAWRENGEIQANPQDYAPVLDDLGRPAWDLMPPTRYHAETLGGFAKRVPAAAIVTGRGCPFHCTFCSSRSIDGHIPRKHSVAHVMEELRILHGQYGTREVKILDDNFTINKPYILDFCRELSSSDLDVIISMPCGVHVTTIDEEILDAFKTIGVYNIPVALESGSQRIVDAMRKGINLEQAREKIELMARKGFEVTCFFIIGYKGETVQDLKKSIKLSLELPLIRAHFNSFCPFPGTEVYDQLRSEGKLEDIPWHLQHMETVNYSFAEGMTRGALTRWRIWALIRFYVFRPWYGWKLMAQVRSRQQLFFLFKKGMEFLAFWRVINVFGRKTP